MMIILTKKEYDDLVQKATDLSAQVKIATDTWKHQAREAALKELCSFATSRTITTQSEFVVRFHEWLNKHL